MVKERKRQLSENNSDSSSSSSGGSSGTDLTSEASADSSRRRRKKRQSESDCSSSDDESSRRRKKKRRLKHKRDKDHRSSRKKKRERHESKSRKAKKARKHHHHEEQEDDANKGEAQSNKLQVTMEAREQEKNLIYQNAELAKARLNGELRDVQAQQAKLQDMYGTIDWRARKKLRLEKKKLERSVAAGKKLAQIEEEESARMDAFRIALGLPTAEAQRQAEWRAQATRALSCQEPPNTPSSKPPKKNIIGPHLPR